MNYGPCAGRIIAIAYHSGMQETIHLDLRGENHVDFDDDSLIHVLTDASAIAPTSTLHDRSIARNRRLRYSQIEWIGVIRLRQPWALVLAVLFLPLGCFWTFSNLGDWGPFSVGAVVLFLLGVLPLVVFVHGRPLLGIASSSHIIIIPMDRKKRRIRRILGLLAQTCTESAVRWELGHGRMAQRATWDTQPRKHRPFRIVRYALISTAFAVIGTINGMSFFPPTRPYAFLAGATIGILGMATALALRQANSSEN
jgi:hypothetical protein